MEKLSVTVSTIGRFHAFNLVQQLQKNDCLHSFISGYPKIAVSRYGNYNIDTKKYRPVSWINLAQRIWRQLPQFSKFDINPQLWFHEKFDLAAQKYISPESNIFVGWSSLCLNSIQRAKDFGAVTIVDRGNSHMGNFMTILNEEYESWGLSYKAFHPGVCQRELQEYSETDFIAVPSLFVKRTFLEKGIPEEKLIHVPYGVCLTEFAPAPKQDDVFRVIHCGGINLRKGIPYLLQAFHELALPKAELWLVGSISEEIKPILDRYASNDNIILKGWYPQAELANLYTQCSIFCLASVEDGFGMVISQAMACGLPIIHTTNTGGEDIVREGIDGFSIPIRDVDKIKEKILFFYENPDKRLEMAENALEQARHSLSWESYGERMIQEYNRVLINH